MRQILIAYFLFFGGNTYSQEIKDKDSLSTQDYVQGLLKKEKTVIIRDKENEYLLISADFQDDETVLIANLKSKEDTLIENDQIYIEIDSFDVELGPMIGQKSMIARIARNKKEKKVRILYSDIISVNGQAPSFSALNLYHSMHLVLLKPNGKERRLQNNWRIKVWTEETASKRGKYLVTGPNEVVIEQDTFKISEIQTIKCSTLKDRNLVGISFIPGGLILFAGALLTDLDPKYGLIVMSIGTAILAPGILGLSLGRKRNTEKGWVINID